MTKKNQIAENDKIVKNGGKDSSAKNTDDRDVQSQSAIDSISADSKGFESPREITTDSAVIANNSVSLISHNIDIISSPDKETLPDLPSSKEPLTASEKYFEHDRHKRLTEEFQNTLDECINEETINYVSLVNIDQLQNKENYEELYIYIKKIINKNVYSSTMTVLEKYKKQEITEKIIEYNINDLENTRNKEFHFHTEEDSFIYDIEEWISENETYKFLS
ncbi:hypothetical protein PMALA_064550 [Plasmodium malariae]|uniref:STP1 protein n=1 Tax=Plasmodium malariae TaxID=5858 RepID=A0A1A8X3F5_PLAMA|nr:hypothetical protein PMALA_064550 [Plasmodium malariae]